MSSLSRVSGDLLGRLRRPEFEEQRPAPRPPRSRSSSGSSGGSSGSTLRWHPQWHRDLLQVAAPPCPRL
eukprot:4093289-Alexandrium_andersonii.AAC.1